MLNGLFTHASDVCKFLDFQLGNEGVQDHVKNDHPGQKSLEFSDERIDDQWLARVGKNERVDHVAHEVDQADIDLPYNVNLFLRIEDHDRHPVLASLLSIFIILFCH